MAKAFLAQWPAINTKARNNPHFPALRSDPIGSFRDLPQKANSLQSQSINGLQQSGKISSGIFSERALSRDA
jgi:hypothetical protein